MNNRSISISIFIATIKILFGVFALLVIFLYHNKHKLPKPNPWIRFSNYYITFNSHISRPVFSPPWAKIKFKDLLNQREQTKIQNSSERKIVLLYTPWPGIPVWIPEWQWPQPQTVYDERGTFFTLESEKFTCPQKCLFTNNHTFLSSADLVLAHVLELHKAPKLPQIRSTKQIWAIVNSESPANHLVKGHHRKGQQGFFNWTSSYRLDSDVYWPYGHFYEHGSSNATFTSQSITLPTTSELRKKKLAVWIVSNCQTKVQRETIVEKLQQFMEIDIYGSCGPLECPIDGDCREILSSRYKFYLAFENSFCLDYVTEKFFEPFDHFMVPVTYGLGAYSKVAPPHSYINLLNFRSLKEFAEYIHFLDNNDEEYLKYFEWRKDFGVLNDPIASGLCSMCVHLWDNGNSVKILKNFSRWWNKPPVDNKMTKLQAKYLNGSVCSESGIDSFTQY